MIAADAGEVGCVALEEGDEEGDVDIGDRA